MTPKSWCLVADRSLSCALPLHSPFFDFPPHPLLSGHFHISKGRGHFGTLVWSLCTWHHDLTWWNPSVFKAMLIIYLKNICINMSVLVANPCPTMKISSFVPLVSELILSSADVPFSPSCMARDSFVRFGNLLPVSAFHIDQPKNKDCKSRRETWFLRFLSIYMSTMG